MIDIVPSRVMNSMHIILDIIFLLGLLVLLLSKKRYMTIVVGLCAGVLYFIVDWGIFYKLQASREIFYNGQYGKSLSESYKAFFLLWLSMSYGFTNFVWMWLWIRKDKFLKEFSIYILIGWLAVAIAGTGLGEGLDKISISRTTGDFHVVMAIFLFCSYGAAVAYNILNKSGVRLPILWFLAIGILVQFGWEIALLLGGVRVGTGPFNMALTAILNSLIETNPAVPVLFLIQTVLYKRYSEELKVNG